MKLKATVAATAAAATLILGAAPASAADKDFFDDLTRLDELLARLARCDVRVPLILKLKPTRDAGVLREIVAIAEATRSSRASPSTCRRASRPTWS